MNFKTGPIEHPPLPVRDDPYTYVPEPGIWDDLRSPWMWVAAVITALIIGGLIVLAIITFGGPVR